MPALQSNPTNSLYLTSGRPHIKVLAYDIILKIMKPIIHVAVSHCVIQVLMPPIATYDESIHATECIAP